MSQFMSAQKKSGRTKNLVKYKEKLAFSGQNMSDQNSYEKYSLAHKHHKPIFTCQFQTN
jgi:hypothetical protein